MNQVSLVLDKVMLKQAEDVYDSAGKNDSFAKQFGKGSKGKSDVQCYKCGDIGHIAANCWGDAASQDLGKNKGKKGGGKGKGMQCYNCKGFGHKSSECPNNRGSKRNADGSNKW